MAGVLVRTLDTLVGGKLEKTSQTQIRSTETVTVKNKQRKSGKTTRKKRIKVSNYEMQFKATGDAELTTLDRVEHLAELKL